MVGRALPLHALRPALLRPRTPIWDAILLLIAGTIIIFGDNAETELITDASGADLNAFGVAARRRQQAGDSIDGYFVDYKGYAGEGVQGGMLMRTAPKRRRPGGVLDPGIAVHMTVGDLASGRSAALAPLRTALAAAPERVRRMVLARQPHSVLTDAAVSNALTPQLLAALGSLRNANTDGAYNHKLKSKREGGLDYMVRSAFNSLRIETPLKARESVEVNARDLDSSLQKMDVKVASDSKIALTHQAKLGAGKDVVQIKLGGVAAGAGAPVSFSVRPGMGGAEIAGVPGGAGNVQVELQSRINGRTVERRYTLPVETGARIEIGSAIDQGELIVGRIDQLFGPQRDVRRIRPQ